MYWSLHRAHPLDAGERAQAAAHVARWRAVIDGYDLQLPEGDGPGEGDLIGWDSLRPSHGDPRRGDQGGYLLSVMGRVFDALAELRSLVPTAELALADDFGTYAWAGDGWEPHARNAREVVSPERRDGWVAAGTLTPAPQALPTAAAPLVTVEPAPQQIAAALAACATVSGPLAVAGWADALAARLALDGWTSRPWTAEVVRTIATIGGRSAWRAVALAADAGLPDSAGALAQLVDYRACATLAAGGHPAWRRFGELGGFLSGTDPIADDAQAAIRALGDAGSSLQGVGRWDDDDDDRSSEIPAAARAAIAAFSAAAAELSLPVDEETQPLLEPTGDETIDELDDAFVAVAVAFAERLAPALVGALTSADREAWRAAALAVAAAPREPLAEEAAAASLSAAAAASSSAASSAASAGSSSSSSSSSPAPTGLAAGLARLDAAAQVATTPAPRPAEVELADGLLSMLAKVADPPSAARVAELGLPASYVGASRSDRADHLEQRLGTLDAALVVTQLLARPEQVVEVYELGRVFTARLGCVGRDPALMDQVLDLWHRSVVERWRGAAGWARLLAPLASAAPVFAQALDVVAGPDRDRSWEAVGGGFDLLGFATGRKDDATAALVARLHADRGNPRDTWRHLGYQALHELGSVAAVPTAILELTAPERVREAARLLPLIGRDPDRGVAVLERALDLPDLAVEATRAICRCAAAAALAPRLLGHPSWTIRLEAARKISDGDLRRAHLIAVWKAIDAARIPMSSEERSRDQESGPVGAPVTLPPLPDPVEGLTSTCADHRHAALRVVDERHDPADAVALVWGDELDLALQRRGHRRSAPRWLGWKPVVPELARGRTARLAWVRAATSTLPEPLRRVRDEGAAAVAATWPPPYLVLSADEQAALRAAEQPLVERGAALLWGD
ncbi:MAG: hypothetical protein IPL61_24845 [Myxococcales bacterium]|nr:hypothetical protein [Myxococcales bacterium]